MTQSYFEYVMEAVLHSDSISIVLNHAIQVYCFTYGILCLLTSLLSATNFIYADSILKIKPIGMFSFVLFWSMKLWTSFDHWMVWTNYIVVLFIAFYFYDGCLNIAESIDIKKQTTTRSGIILILTNIALIIPIYFFRHIAPHQKDQADTSDTWRYIGLIINLLLINLYRVKQRSLFPSLIVILITNLTMLAKQLLLLKGFTKNIPFQALIYIMLVIDAQGRQFRLIQNKVVHHLFLTCLYFYGFVITNQRNFHVEYFLLGISIFMMILNK